MWIGKNEKRRAASQGPRERRGKEGRDGREDRERKAKEKRRASEGIQPVGYAINGADGAASTIRLASSSTDEGRKTIESLSSGLKSLQFMKRNVEDTSNSQPNGRGRVRMSRERERVEEDGDDNRWTLVLNPFELSNQATSSTSFGSGLILATDSDERADLSLTGRVCLGGYTSPWRAAENDLQELEEQQNDEDNEEDILTRLANLRQDQGKIKTSKKRRRDGGAR